MRNEILIGQAGGVDAPVGGVGAGNAGRRRPAGRTMSGQHHHLGASASRGRRRVDSGTVNSSEMAKNFSVATAIPQPEPALAAAGSGSAVMASRGADVGKLREHLRQRRLAGLAVSLGTLLGYLIWRAVHAQPAWPGMPHIDWMIAVPILFFVALLAVLLGTTVVAGRSPT